MPEISFFISSSIFPRFASPWGSQSRILSRDLPRCAPGFRLHGDLAVGAERYTSGERLRSASRRLGGPTSPTRESTDTGRSLLDRLGRIARKDRDFWAVGDHGGGK